MSDGVCEATRLPEACRRTIDEIGCRIQYPPKCQDGGGENENCAVNVKMTVDPDGLEFHEYDLDNEDIRGRSVMYIPVKNLLPVENVGFRPDDCDKHYLDRKVIAHKPRFDYCFHVLAGIPGVTYAEPFDKVPKGEPLRFSVLNLEEVNEFAGVIANMQYAERRKAGLTDED